MQSLCISQTRANKARCITGNAQLFFPSLVQTGGIALTCPHHGTADRRHWSLSFTLALGGGIFSEGFWILGTKLMGDQKSSDSWPYCTCLLAQVSIPSKLVAMDICIQTATLRNEKGLQSFEQGDRIAHLWRCFFALLRWLFYLEYRWKHMAHKRLGPKWKPYCHLWLFQPHFSHFHFAPVCLQVALVLSLPPARWVKDFGSHPCISPIPSLLVSSPVLHSGWAGMEDFGSCVFVALTTASSSWGFWLSCPCFPSVLPVYFYLLRVFATHDMSVQCGRILFGVYAGV